MKVSAGLLMYRKVSNQLEVFLVHPGGPFFARRDNGIWGIPKGERHDEEDLLNCAKREFSEETNIEIPKNAVYCELGSTTYTNGKVVYCWAFENDLPKDFALKSNHTKYGWPEIDRGEFMNLKTAEKKILPAQKNFLTKLLEQL